MLNKTLFLALAATLAALLSSSRAHAWGCYHAGYTHVGYGGVQHYGYTAARGPYGSYSGGHVSGYGYGGGYHAGYGYGDRYGGGAYGGAYHYGSSSYGGAYGGGFHYGGYGDAYRGGYYRAW
jgi:hypothetical protein